MARARRSATTAVDRLIDHLLAEREEPELRTELGAWVATSAGFRAFADAHRDKIRKKLRSAGDADALRDVRAELGVAALLLADRRFELAFEAHGAGHRGPDFTVTFRSSRAFDLEVTRHRGDPAAATHAGPLLVKLRQLQPSIANVLVIAVEGPSALALDLASGIRRLRERADAKDEGFFQRRGFEGTRDFYHRFLRLGAVVVLAESGSGEERLATWENPSARIAPPQAALRACVAALNASAA